MNGSRFRRSRYHAAIATTWGDQRILAIAHRDDDGRFYLDLAQPLRLLRRCWGDPRNLAELQRDLRNSGIAVTCCHPLGPRARPPGRWFGIDDAVHRATLTALASAAWASLIEDDREVAR